jgi:5'-nucleotidase
MNLNLEKEKVISEVIEVNPEKLKLVKEKMAAEGPAKLHIVTDFDKTLTYTFVGGRKIESLIAVLREEGYLTPDYPEKAKALAAKYKPIEDDPNIPLAEKKQAMRQWWLRHYELLKQSGLNKKDVEQAIKSSLIRLRDGVEDFFRLCAQKQIPIIIISANGLGDASIVSFLKQKNILSKNVYIISNRLQWDKEGNFVGVKEPIIYSFNKDEKMIKYFPEIEEQVKGRHNIILLGDGLGDVDMIRGVEYKRIIKVGFLNQDDPDRLEIFKRYYDVIIIGDSSFAYVNELMKEARE